MSGIRHVVCLRFVDDPPDGAVDSIVEHLCALPSRIAAIEGYHVGRDLGINPGTFDLVVVGDFADADAYRTYRDHPEHRRVIDDLITPILVDSATVQSERT